MTDPGPAPAAPAAAAMDPVSVVVPALNEERTVEPVVRGLAAAFAAAGADWELILVDDGSRDRTGALMEALARDYPSVRVVHHPAPLGIGAGFRSGLALARHERVTWFPADGENRPEELLRLLRAAGPVDIVVPYHRNLEVRAPLRRAISALYQLVVRTAFRVPVRYTNGTALYRRSIFRRFTPRSDGFFFQAEVIIRAARAGCTFAEFPIALATRRGGRSKAISLRSLRVIVGDFLRLWAELRAAGPSAP